MKLADELERLVTDYQWPKSRATVARAVAALRAIEEAECVTTGEGMRWCRWCNQTASMSADFRHRKTCPARIAAEGVGDV